MLLRFIDFQNGGHQPSWISHFFAIFVKNSNRRLFLRRLAKFDEDWTICGQVIAYFLFSKWRPSAILDFCIFTIFVKNSSLRLYLRRHAKFGEKNLVKIGRSAAELLRIDFQNGGHPPSWIWYDIMVDHPRLVFHGPNILLKLHIDRFNTLRDIAIFPA